MLASVSRGVQECQRAHEMKKAEETNGNGYDTEKPAMISDASQS